MANLGAKVYDKIRIDMNNSSTYNSLFLKVVSACFYLIYTALARITTALLWPAELRWHVFVIIILRCAKVGFASIACSYRFHFF